MLLVDESCQTLFKAPLLIAWRGLLTSAFRLTTAERCPKANERPGRDHNERDWLELVDVGNEIAKAPVSDEWRKLPLCQKTQRQRQQPADDAQGSRSVCE